MTLEGWRTGSMTEIGSVIEAIVTRIEHYGVYLQHQGETVLVLIPEVAWQPVKDLKEAFHPGDRLKVYALRYNYVDRAIVGSFRRLHPEENPYRALSRLEPATVLRGRVAHSYGDSLTVQLPNAVRGEIPLHKFRHGPPKPGDEIDVTIASLEVDEGRLWLEPFSLVGTQTNGAASTQAST